MSELRYGFERRLEGQASTKLVTAYVWLAHREARDVRKELGPVWDEYAARTPGFIPRPWGHRRRIGGERSAHV
ncbi:MAG: hypothetical protein IT384_19145 [Deltaproteobacteria bacterium]|nr:hypothetical protein [Deltaproteobacteria bacterium]